MNTVFPHTKTKAHILRDREGEDEPIGRFASKAVDLIVACSAFFLHDLATTASTNASSELSNGTSYKKRQRQDQITGAKATKKVPPAACPVLTLEDIRESIKQPEYAFLEDILDDLTEHTAPRYDSLARKRRRRRERARAGGDAKKTKTCDAVMESIVKQDEGNAGAALQEAIAEAQEGMEYAERTKEIVEDDDDYD